MHISQTLPKNLERNKRFEKDIEFVLVNFINSQEGVKTDEWVRRNFRREIISGYLKYFVTNKVQYFHMSEAKNTAHMNASGMYLFNLDADNYITPEEMKVLLGRASGGMVHLWSGTYRDGSHGRIGLGSYEFRKLGGYNEYLEAYTFQDADLLCRWITQLKRRVLSLTKSSQSLHDILPSKSKKLCFFSLIPFKWKKGSYFTTIKKLRLRPKKAIQHASTNKKEKELRKELHVKNIHVGRACTQNYLRPLKQDRIGHSTIRITEDNIDRQFFLTCENEPDNPTAETAPGSKSSET